MPEVNESRKLMFDISRIIENMIKCKNDRIFFLKYGGIISQYFTISLDNIHVNILFEQNIVQDVNFIRFWNLFKRFPIVEDEQKPI